MAQAPPDVPGLMEIFLMVAKMLILEELEFQIQRRLSPAEGLVFFYGVSGVVKGDSSGWWTRIVLVITANKSSSSSGEV